MTTLGGGIKATLGGGAASLWARELIGDATIKFHGAGWSAGAVR